MTEQKAREILKRDYEENIREEGYKEEFGDVLEAEKVAISALREIQQYKKIGSVEDYRQLKDLVSQLDLNKLVKLRESKDMEMDRVTISVEYCQLLESEEIEVILINQLLDMIKSKKNL